MNDLGEYLKQCLQKGTVPLQNLHKKKGDNFGTLLEAERREQKNTELNNRRKEERSTLLEGLRQIDANMSPITPQPQRRSRRQAANAANLATNNAPPPPPPAMKKMPARLQMLAKWKEEKTKRAQEAKRHAKPAFKVCHVSHPVGLPDLHNVNAEIKGKRFVVVNNTSKFAPENHQFRPPANIRPIEFARPLPNDNEVTTMNTKNGSNTVAQNAARRRREENNKKTPIKEKRSRLGRMGKAVEEQPLDADEHGAQLNGRKLTESVASTSSGVSTRTRNRTNSAAQQGKITTIQNRKNETPKPAKSAGNKSAKTAKSRAIIATSSTQNEEKSSAAETESVASTSSGVSTRTRNRTNSAAQQGKSTIQNRKNETPKPAKSAGNKSAKTAKSRAIIATSSTQNEEKSSAAETEREVPLPVRSTTLNKTPVRTAPTGRSNNEVKSTTTPVYISPFVTVSRGKDSARKEYESRRSRGGTSLVDGLSQYTSPTAGAKYFAAKLDCEIARLERICDGWNQYKAENDPPEEVVSMINVAVGQCTLLITKKFEQFRGLIDECRNQTSAMSVTCTDLHGFWDMMYLQVENVEQRFANLDRLKAANWEVLLPRQQPQEKEADNKERVGRQQKAAKAAAPVVVATGGDGEGAGVAAAAAKKTKAAPGASSTLREAIRAARRRKQMQAQSDIELSAQDAAVVSEAVAGATAIAPSMSGNGNSSSRPTPVNGKRKMSAVLQSLVFSETKKRNSSPGLLMMKVAQLGKTLGTDTPAKSILKSDAPKSSARKSKVVLFKEDGPTSVENTENDLNRSNTDSSKSVKEKTPSRRSTRLSRTKLF